MNTILKFTSPTLLLVLVAFYSCKKEFLNHPPVANAGPDQTIILPLNSVTLDGSSSTDPDNNIASYAWTKVSGPSSPTIVNANAVQTQVTVLVQGVYQFELKVTDAGGLSSKDTMQVMVDAPGNQPPVACAGADQVITLPINTVNLHGSCSADPDNNITSYSWTKISGPASFNITNASAVQTLVNNLVQGVYQFELKVTDAGGLFSKDTMQLKVSPYVASVDCNGNTRPQVNAQLIPIGTLSQSLEVLAIASAGNKILFAPGYPSGTVSSRIDIFDISTNSWSTAELSQPRTGVTTVVLGNKIFLGGGWAGRDPSSRVDIYDAVTNTWSTAELSMARGNMCAAAAGNKVLFAGGANGFFKYSTTVDIYDAVTNTWSASSLTGRTPTGTVGMTATSIGDKIYFAGEGSDWFAWDFGSISSTINIYDVSTNTWSLSDLSIARGFMAGIAVGTKIYWAGGLYTQPDDAFTNLVEIRDANTGSSTFSCLFQPNAFSSAVLKNNKIVFFTAGEDMPTRWTGPPPVHNKFDIYDITTNSWSVGVLPQSMYGTSIISVNNTIYVAGGFVNGVLSNKVWKLEF